MDEIMAGVLLYATNLLGKTSDTQMKPLKFEMNDTVSKRQVNIYKKSSNYFVSHVLSKAHVIEKSIRNGMLEKEMRWAIWKSMSLDGTLLAIANRPTTIPFGNEYVEGLPDLNMFQHAINVG